jgi:arylsulfatase
VFFEAATNWIKHRKDDEKPFFAYIATNAPHGPFIAPPKNTKRFTDLGFGKDQAGFYGMVENIDENIGRFMDQLGRWNLLDKTFIIFMSDNGMTGGGSGRPGQAMGHLPDGTPMLPYNAGMKGLKGSSDEGGVRVPFFVRWDGRIKAGRDIDRIAAHIDVFPTIATLAGADIPSSQVEGRNLLPLLEGARADWSDRFLFTHQGRWKTGENPDDYQWKNFAVRNQQFRFVNNNSLYDMQKDPGQTTNIIEQHPELVAQMRAAYEAFWRETRPLMVNEDVPMSPTRPFHELYRQQMAAGGIPDWNPR